MNLPKDKQLNFKILLEAISGHRRNLLRKCSAPAPRKLSALSPEKLWRKRILASVRAI